MNTVFSALYATIIWPLRDRLRREDGLEAVEYALIAALLSVVVITAVGILGGDATNGIEGLFTSIRDTLNGAGAEINPGTTP